VPVLIALLLALAACSSSAPVSAPTQAPATSGGYPAGGVAAAGRLADGTLALVDIAGDRIKSISAGPDTGFVLWPPIVDSHVHLAYYPVADRLITHGIGAAVDLAAPEAALGAAAPLTVIASGPMITRPGGYPLDSWGVDGYGIGCADTACVRAAIDRLAAGGARVIKLPLDVGGLPRDFLEQAVDAAHAKRLKVAVHALSEEAAARAAAAGADILAHTPAEPLSDATVRAWSKGAVITTLAAFGSPAAVENLRKLRAAGATILYGTDLGNLRVDGVSADEVALMRKADLDDAAITAAMTTTPIAYWQLPLELAPDREATFLLLDGDPRKDANVLLHPHAVFVRGKSVGATK
jgi:imidazolonepropionase-like amidohydrolase